MRRLVRSEIRKALSTRVPLVLLVVATAVTVVSLTATAVLAGREIADATMTPALDTEAGMHALLASASSGSVLALVLGILGVTGEYRHLTITQTFLGAPRRYRVVSAKLLTYLLLGGLFGLVVTAVGLGAGELALLVAVEPVSPLRGDVAAILGGAVLSHAMYTLVGVGVGALLRNQVVAVVTVVVWTQLVENMLVGMFPPVGRWLLTGASSAVVRYGESTGLALLPVWAGALLLAGYAAVFGAAAYATTTRRDVT
ncbi:MAG: ABC transporter permease [Streptosporangiales bacterium]|nr:ABC transporter permease [Streptosporangiales bacterium]